MSPASQIESIQPDVVSKLGSESWFNTIQVYAIREKRLDTEISQALAGLGAKAGKKGGATIEVLMPTLRKAEPDAPGPISTIAQKFIVKEQPTLNLGANGTGLTAEQIAVQIIQVFDKFFLGGPMQGFYPADEPYVYKDAGPGAPFVAVEVTMLATFAITPLAQTAQPAVATADSGGNVIVTLTDTQPGGGSNIYYTINGSFPGSGNATAVKYTTPFTVPAGTALRTAAYNGSLAGSMVDNFLVN